MLQYCTFILLSVVLVLAAAQTPSSNSNGQATYGVLFDDVVVESSLNLRRKATPVRHVRNVHRAYELQALPMPLMRVKRQFNNNNQPFGFGQNPNYGSSSAIANANAFNQQFRPDGFGSSAANAGAQAFQANGPLGGFGAAASNAQSQGFNVGPNGLTGSAGLSGGQTYNLPNGDTLSLTYGNSISIGPDGRPVASKGNSIAFTKAGQ